MSALIDSGSEVNAIHPLYAKKLDLDIQTTNMKAQKIDGTTLETFEIVIAGFSVHDKARKVCFFEETFLFANINIEIALGMLFLILNTINIYFTDRELYERSYSIPKTLPTTCHIELIDQKVFAAAVFGKDNKTFVVHVASMTMSSEMSIHPFRAAQ